MKLELKNKGNVLIVEDQVITVMTLEQNLKELGYGVTGAVDCAKDVIKSVEKNKPDVILMDIYLKGNKTGIDVTKELNLAYDIPIIYLTASSDHNTYVEASATKHFGYIVKPFYLHDLQTSLKMALFRSTVDKKLIAKGVNLNEVYAMETYGKFKWDIVDNYVEWCDKTYLMFGLEPQEFEATFEAFLNFVATEDQEDLQYYVDLAFHRKQRFNIYYRLNRKDGSQIIISTRGDVKFNESGDPISMTGTTLNLSELL